MKNSWENVAVDNSSMGLYLSQPDSPSPVPAIIVIQNKYGVKEFTQEMTRRVAEAGYVGIAPLLYHRTGEPKGEDEIEKLRPLRSDTNIITDLNATIGYLKGCAKADTSRLGIVGFCMGGRVAFLAAAATTSFSAVVDYYGGGVYSKWGKDRPAPSELAANISCPIQGHFGDLDTSPSPEEMRKLDAELDRIGKQHEFFFYDNAPHSFNNSGMKKYCPDADKTSWQRTLEFFAKHLAPAERKKTAAG
ncbi:MAG: dienelactone hydrolase family protein [Candidatus Binatia bacterium]